VRIVATWPHRLTSKADWPDLANAMRMISDTDENILFGSLLTLLGTIFAGTERIQQCR